LQTTMTTRETTMIWLKRPIFSEQAQYQSEAACAFRAGVHGVRAVTCVRLPLCALTVRPPTDAFQSRY
jgi:hypothetical protein